MAVAPSTGTGAVAALQSSRRVWRQWRRRISRQRRAEDCGDGAGGGSVDRVELTDLATAATAAADPSTRNGGSGDCWRQSTRQARSTPTLTPASDPPPPPPPMATRRDRRRIRRQRQGQWPRCSRADESGDGGGDGFVDRADWTSVATVVVVDPSTETGGSGLVADELTSLATVATVDQSIEPS